MPSWRTEFGDQVLATQAVQHDADLIFGAVALAGCSTDAFDDLFGDQGVGVGFLTHLRSLAATMSKSSLPQQVRQSLAQVPGTAHYEKLSNLWITR